MPSFEEEDERISTQRAMRRTRKLIAEPSARAQDRVMNGGRVNGLLQQRRAVEEMIPEEDNEDQESENSDAENSMANPQPSALRKRRTTPSVSFSEPVETPPPFQGPPQHENGDVPQPRRRNRLEKRLEELQRDVANLSLRLRASSTTASQLSLNKENENGDFSMHSSEDRMYNGRSNDRELNPRSTFDSQLDDGLMAQPVRPAKSPARTILKKIDPKTPPSNINLVKQTDAAAQREELYATVHEKKLTPSRHAVRKSHVEEPKSHHDMLRAVRELKVVGVDRDRLRYELEQTKKALAAMEKKYHEAAKWKDSYDKMKAHCTSLQESLELSEKIRIRQKRLLQQLQQTIKQGETVEERHPVSSRLHKPRAHIDVLDSILQDSRPPETERRPPLRQVQPGQVAASTVTTRTRSRPVLSPRGPAKTADVNTSRRSYSRSDFDSLLQVPLADRSIAGSTAVSKLGGVRRDTMTSRERQVSRIAPRTARPNPAPAPTSSRISSRPTTTATTRTSHFLAPTQASLSQMTKKKPEPIRRPFFV